MMITNPYTRVTFNKSAAKLSQLPDDSGYEVAFVGRSNSGKSSALNTLTQNKRLARTSKTPGRTQLINLFNLDETRRLVDLPGYGYAKVSASIQRSWKQLLADYLRERQSLQGLIIIMDCRHPLTSLDEALIDFAARRNLKLHILLTKSDKLSRNKLRATEIKVKKALADFQITMTVQPFSSLKKEGVETLITTLNGWLEWP
jgi:GTP-binding protein